jgi:hypothetical protein
LKRAKTFSLITFHLLSIISAYSQVNDIHSRIIVTGAVYDIESLDSLPSFEILVNKKRIITDNNGSFCARLLKTDTLTILHLGYVTSEIMLSELITNLDSLQLNVLMKEQIYEIPEVSVLPYRTYGEFIRAVTNQNIDQRLINASENICGLGV